MGVIEKVKKLTDEEILKVCATDMVSKQELGALISDMSGASSA